MSNDDPLRERSESAQGGGIRHTQSRPEVTSIKIDDKLDLPPLQLSNFMPQELDKKAFTEKMKDVPSSNLKIDVTGDKLAQLGNSINDILKQQQNKQLREYLEQAQRYLNAKLYREALGPLEKALSIDATSIPTQFLKGYCFFCLKEYEQAATVLREARSRLNPRDAEMLFLIFMLETACTNAITQTIQKRVEWFLAQERYQEALAYVSNELRQRPKDPTLLYEQCGILMLMERFADARREAHNAISWVGPRDAPPFLELLKLIDQYETSQSMKKVRLAIKRGDLHTAAYELENCRTAFGEQERYKAILAYIEERRHPSRGMRSGGLFGFLSSGKDKQKRNLQIVLLWLFTEELTAGMAALERMRFAEAINALATADRIDSRCGMVAYLHGLALFLTLQQMVKQKARAEDIDLAQANQLLDQATRKLTQAADDPLVEKSVRNLQAVIQSNSADISFAQCVRSFKTMTDYYQQHPIKPFDYTAKREAQQWVTAQLQAIVVALNRQPRGSQNVRILSQLEKSLRTLERQLS